ncbi:hypothetical protein EON66_07525, partial [archaeon]
DAEPHVVLLQAATPRTGCPLQVPHACASVHGGVQVVFLGDQGCGKTSIIKAYMFGSFDHNYQATIGIDFLSKTVHLDDHVVRLQIWDSAGQECVPVFVCVLVRSCVQAPPCMRACCSHAGCPPSDACAGASAA